MVNKVLQYNTISSGQLKLRRQFIHLHFGSSFLIMKSLFFPNDSVTIMIVLDHKWQEISFRQLSLFLDSFCQREILRFVSPLTLWTNCYTIIVANGFIQTINWSANKQKILELPKTMFSLWVSKAFILENNKIKIAL